MDLRGEVAQFLTGLRARLSPEQAGVPVLGGQRRVPGLRREEVAQLAGVSTTYYTRIERGNLRGVSDSVLRSLARTLRMTEAETQHLFDLARAATGTRSTGRARPAPRVPQRAVQLMDAMTDIPVVILGRLGEVLGANTLGQALFPDLFPEQGPPLNHTRYLFLDERARRFYPDWEHSARQVVSALRLLATHSPEFRTWWAGHTVTVHAGGTKTLHHPVVGELTVAFETLTLASAPGIRIITYLTDPATPSADALDMLRSWVATEHSPSASDAPAANALDRQQYPPHP
ncbi:helix-turn-helix transcriptional regulator [Nocardia vinacea]|uniref:Helix-turn-helix transcriptional regulator n=1 Tax=Nocardia vinacea TaxID=96468 RepID=A0ABZ1YPV6_9NOCA|nr:helix-turn-helix transcriptional regulator [Nocardia vinacea]